MNQAKKKPFLATVLLAVSFIGMVFASQSPPGQISTQQNSIAIAMQNEVHPVSAACQSANGEEVALVFDQTVIANSSNDIAYNIAAIAAGSAPDNPSAGELHFGLNHRINMISADRDLKRATGESLYKRDAYQWCQNLCFASSSNIPAVCIRTC